MGFGEVSAAVKGTYQVEAPPYPKCPLTIARLIDVELSQTTCQPFYDDDRQRLAMEIVDALKAQGYRVTKNAVGDHSCAGPVNVTRLAEALKRVVVRVTMMD
jgi:hypothetical protein